MATQPDQKEFFAAVGKRIRQLRMKKSLTQLELSILCNVQPATLCRLELGQTNAGVGTIKIVCTGLQVSMTEFFSGVEKWD